MVNDAVKNEYELLTAFRNNSNDLKKMRAIAENSNDNSEDADKIKSIVEGIDNATTFSRALSFTEVSYGNSNRKLVDTAIFFGRFVDDFAKFAYHEKSFREGLVSRMNELGFTKGVQPNLQR